MDKGFVVLGSTVTDFLNIFLWPAKIKIYAHFNIYSSLVHQGYQLLGQILTDSDHGFCFSIYFLKADPSFSMRL